LKITSEQAGFCKKNFWWNVHNTLNAQWFLGRSQFHVRTAPSLETVFEIINGGSQTPLEEKEPMNRLLSVLSVFAIASVAAGTASAGPIISTPTGLHPGDHFRIAFVTTGTLANTVSSNIATYDSFVTTDAGGATYNGNTITWQAIASTPSEDAIAHIGIKNDPVYLVDGSRVALTDAALWSGSLQHAINETINGTGVSGSVATGTFISGVKFNPLGSGLSQFGLSGFTTNRWISFNAVPSSASGLHLYGISQELTVPAAAAVPEPSTAVLAGLGGLAALAYSLKRKRN
jgi:hypothetical protein